MKVQRNLFKLLFTLLLALSVGSAAALPLVAQAHSATAETTYVVQRGDTLYSIARRYGTTVAAIQRANGLTSDRIYVGQRLTIPGGSSEPAPGTPSTYVVQRGDTLYRIAQRFGTTVTAIKQANNLRSDTIYIGQRLTIPGGSGQPQPTPGQPTVERIQFAPGATSATVTGTVSDPVSRQYVLRAQAGQSLHVRLQSAQGTASVSVRGSDGQVLKAFGASGNEWTGVLPKSQDYVIEIVTLEFSSTAYTLFVEIPGGSGQPQPTPGNSSTYVVQRGDTLSKIAQRFGTTVAAIKQANNLRSDTIYIGQRLTIPGGNGQPQPTPGQPTVERIQFAPGATSATVTGTVSDPVSRQYVLRAQAGQSLHVRLQSAQGTASVSVRGSDGQVLKAFGASGNEWTGVLPKSQDYVIEIVTLEFSSTAYTLFVEIPGGST